MTSTPREVTPLQTTAHNMLLLLSHTQKDSCLGVIKKHHGKEQWSERDEVPWKLTCPPWSEICYIGRHVLIEMTIITWSMEWGWFCVVITILYRNETRRSRLLRVTLFLYVSITLNFPSSDIVLICFDRSYLFFCHGHALDIVAYDTNHHFFYEDLNLWFYENS